MDEEAGKCLSGWHFYKHDRKIAGGLAPTIKDALHTNPENEDSNEEMTKLLNVCHFLFVKSNLSGGRNEIMFASILRYWFVFTELMEKKVQDKDHFIIQQVKRACFKAGVCYKNDFLH